MSKFKIPTQTIKESLLKWRESYNCHSVYLARGLEIKINWDSTRSKNDNKTPPWKVVVFGNMVGRYNSFEDAEMAAIKAANDFLEIALNKVVDALMKAQKG